MQRRHPLAHTYLGTGLFARSKPSPNVLVLVRLDSLALFTTHQPRPSSKTSDVARANTEPQPWPVTRPMRRRLHTIQSLKCVNLFAALP